MAQVVNTNVMSLNAQRQLMLSQRTQNEAMERLSSGLRINASADDAAGLAISDRMTAQIRGMNMAIRNSNDAISVVQIADGALQETTNMLQRMREVAVQAANGSNTSFNRVQLQDEMNQLKAEMTRIANNTNFNGLNLLDGSYTDTRFHIGASATEDVEITMNSMKARDLQRHSHLQGTGGGIVARDGAGTAVIPTNTDSTGAIAFTFRNSVVAQDITVAGYRGGAQITGASTGLLEAGSTAQEIAALVNEKTSETGVTAKATTEAYISMRDSTGLMTALDNGAGLLTFNLAANDMVTRGSSATLSGPGVVEVSGLVTTTGNMTAVAESINKLSGTTGITATLSQDRTFIKLTQDEGRDIDIQGADFFGVSAGVPVLTVKGATEEPYDANGDLNPDFFASSYFDSTGAFTPATAGGLGAWRLFDESVSLSTGTTVIAGRVEFESTRSFGVQTTVTAGGVVQVATANDGVASSSAKVSEIDIGSIEGAIDAIKIVDIALAYVDDQRAYLGAMQNRIESTINNLTNVSNNTEGARSRIQDADFALESAKLSKAQVLQQAGTSMLTQANATAQQVLQLLQG